MKKVSVVVVGLLLLVVGMGDLSFAQQDAKGCKDHPFLTRMEGFYIKGCEKKDFDSHEFYDPVTKQAVKKRKAANITLTMIEKSAKDTSNTQISRNYANAVKAIGGAVFMKRYQPHI